MPPPSNSKISRFKYLISFTCTICKKSFIKFRSTLEENKIFIDLSSTLFIGGASLVVAYAALNINNKMLDASEVAALPHFSIGARARFDSAKQTYTEETLILNNNGAPISNLNWKTITFIALQQSGTRSYTLIPINGYYFGQFPTSNVTGALSTAVGHLNKEKFSAIYDEALRYNSDNKSEGYFFPQIVTFSKVSYEDRLNREGVVYFKDHTKIPKNIAQPIFEYSQSGPLLDLGLASLTDIIKKSKQPDALILNQLP